MTDLRPGRRWKTGALRTAGPVCLLLVLSACAEPDIPGDYVARVGTEELEVGQLTDMLAAMPVGRDTAAVVQQMVDQWIVNALLEQEARRLNLTSDPDVSRLLAENERSVLVSAYVNHLYEENPVEPSLDDVTRFFELNQERLRLRESFVRVRYLQHPDRDTVLAARTELQRAMRGPDADSLWTEIARRYSADVEGSRALAANHLAESRLFAGLPGVKDVLSRLGERQVSRVISEGGRFHLLQLVDRVPAGSLPELRWVEDEIVRQLILQGRKQTFARTVQNLRNMATARNDLEIRIPDSLGAR